MNSLMISSEQHGDANFRMIFQDAGDYVCQISDRVARDQVHTVEVLVPPSVRASPETRHVTARRGGAAVLECRAAGNPVPTVTWHRLVSFKIRFRIRAPMNYSI